MDRSTPGHAIAALRQRFLGGGLVARVFRGSVWATGAFGCQKLVQLASSLLLTRLLAPEIFGLMVLAHVFLIGLHLLSDIGTQASIVRSPRGEDRAYLETAWTLQILRGLAITAFACALAWPVSRLYQEPDLFPVMLALSATAAISGFSSIGVAIQRRRLAVSRIAALELSSQVLSVSATVVAAWLLGSVWALVIGAIIGSMIQVTLSHLVLPPAPHALRLERAALRDILGFGRWILLATMFTFLGGQGIQAVQGYLVPLDVLGLLAIAGNLAAVPGDLAGRLLGGVGFPALSELARERPQDLARAVRRLRRPLLFAIIPFFLVLSLGAEPLIGLLYDDRYAMAGSFLGLLALNAAVGVLPMVYQSALLATGDSKTHSFVMMVSAGLRIGGVLAGFALGAVTGMIVGLGVATLMVYLLSAVLAGRRGYLDAATDGAVLCLIAAVYVGQL